MVKVKVSCAFCGEELERKESDILRCKSGMFFCNNEHRIAHEKEHGNWNRGRHIVRGWKRPEALSVAG